MRVNGPLALAFHALFIAFILAPLAIVCVVSFTPLGYISLPTDGLSLRWFGAILDNPRFIRAFWLSLTLGLVSSLIASALAIPAALAISRHRFPGRDAISAFLLSPLMIPSIVLGVAFLRFFSTIRVNGTFGGLVVGHVIIILPFALRLVLAAATGMDPAVERAAVSLGARRWTVFRRVTLPLVLPGIVSGWLLAFITSFDELTMSVFIASPSTTTLPVRMFLHIQDTIDPLVTAVSALLIGGTAVLMWALDRLVGLERLFVGGSRHSG
ncbi:MAG TPA: ABC transporter permease [Casimicrobiaceae bacterium]|nr:ABC transporter permease [Casimicrobiaceae bacterium]